MTVRANWFSGAHSQSDHDEADPFADTQGLKSSELSVDSSQDEIMARLAALSKREGRLAAQGITCPLKEAGECSCSACPVSRLSHPEESKSALCRVGQTQERLVMMSLAKTHGLVADDGGR